MHLLGAAAGEERDEALAGIEAVGGERRGALARRAHPVEQRMADEVGAHAVRRVERGLEREDHREAVTRRAIFRTRPRRHAHTCGLM